MSPVESPEMERLDRTATRAVRQLLEAQPLTEAKVRFAWTLAAGPALARATTLTFTDGVLTVRTRSTAWHQELTRAEGLLRARLDELLGAGAVRRLTVAVDRAGESLR